MNAVSYAIDTVIPEHPNWSLPPAGQVCANQISRHLNGPPAREITREELAAHYHVHPRTVDYWRRRKFISWKKIGRTVRFDLPTVQREIESRFERKARMGL